MKRGFSLLELIIVVIVIALLVAIAMPFFMKSMEKSKTGEAATNLNIIRMAEKDYRLDNPTFASTIGSLNIDDPGSVTNRYFNYNIISFDANNFTARATRMDGPYSGDYYEINKDGFIADPSFSHSHFQL